MHMQSTAHIMIAKNFFILNSSVRPCMQKACGAAAGSVYFPGVLSGYAHYEVLLYQDKAKQYYDNAYDVAGKNHGNLRRIVFRIMSL
jgi:hypothetical protein